MEASRAAQLAEAMGGRNPNSRAKTHEWSAEPMKAIILAALPVALRRPLGGCAQGHRRIQPRARHVARRQRSDRRRMTPSRMLQVTRRPVDVAFNSIYSRNTSEDLFRDARAMRVGDVVTVKVSIQGQGRSSTTTPIARAIPPRNVRARPCLAAAVNGSLGDGSLER